jgi:hypothetical protein
MKNSGKYQLFAFVLIAAGFILYVAADKGIFASDFSAFKFEVNKNLISDTEKINQELDEVSTASKDQKKKLLNLISEFKELDQQVSEQKQKLRKLVTLASKMEKHNKREIASSTVKVASIQSFIDKTREVLGNQVQVRFVEQGDERYLKVSQGQLFHGEDYYMRPSGIQFVHHLEKAMASLNIDHISLILQSGSKLELERARVFENFVAEVSHGNLKVSSTTDPEAIASADLNEKFEIMIHLKSRTRGS